MARETKAERVEREYGEMRELLDRREQQLADTTAERNRLEDRCTFLFMQAEDFAAALVQARLGNMTPAPGTRIPERGFGGRLKVPDPMQYLEVKERLR